MIDEWSGLADMLANLIEKYASDLDIENLPDIAGDNHAKDDRNKAEELSKNEGCILLIIVTKDTINMIRVSKLLLGKIPNNEVTMDYREEEIGKSNMIIYTIEDGLSKMETIFDGDMVWLSLARTI